MKILFVLASPEYLRFYDSVLSLLAARGHDVAVAVNHVKEQKQARVEGMEGVRSLGLVPARHDRWSRLATGIRGTTDFLRYFHPDYLDAPALRDRMRRKVLPHPFDGLSRIRSLGPGTLGAGLSLLGAAERGVPVSGRVLAFLQEHRPDVLVVSPLIDAASDQVDVVRAARRLGIRVAVAIASWDNLTNKGLMRVEPDLVLVWNNAQKAEAVRYHGVPADKVVVTGAQLFDRWFERSASTTRDAFCARAGLADARPYLLYTASSVFIARSEVELPFVRRWIAALRASSDPRVRDMPVLVRPHPYNWHAWEHADLSGLGNVAVWPRGPYNAVDEANRAGFFDSMAHAAAVIGVNTSAMIESAIVGRPVFSLTGDFAGTQEGTMHFRYLLPENGGFLRVAATLDEHVTQLSGVLADPAGATAETARFVASFVRPHGVDRPCTPIVAETLERFGAAPPPPPDHGSLLDLAARTLLRPVAALVNRAPARKGGTPKGKAKGTALKVKAPKKDGTPTQKDGASKAEKAAAAVGPIGISPVRVPGPSAADPVAIFADVRDRVRSVLAHERGLLAGAAVPSAYWSEELGNIDYLIEATPLVIAKLRHHAFHITGLRPYDYRDSHADKRAAFEARLRALVELGGGSLVVPEHPALGGFGFEVEGALHNLDTLKYLEVLTGLQRSGVLGDLRAVTARPDRRPVVWEIGAGWGGFAYQFTTLVSPCTYVITDFPELFLFSATYLRTVCPAAKTLIWDAALPEAVKASWRECDFVFVPHTRTHELPGFRPDLLVNIASFQEMTAAQVDAYAGLAARSGCPRVYSLNREHSAHNAELSSVAGVLGRYYEVRDVTLLDADYTSAMKKAPKGPRKGERRAEESLHYRHVTGALRMEASRAPLSEAVTAS